MKIRSIDELCELVDLMDETEKANADKEIFEVKTQIKEVRAYLESLRFIHDIEPNPIIKMEIRNQLSILKELKQILVGLYIMKLETEFPKADALYEDKIIECIGKDGFYCIHFGKAIELCACINGRRLYAI